MALNIQWGGNRTRINMVDWEYESEQTICEVIYNIDTSTYVILSQRRSI